MSAFILRVDSYVITGMNVTTGVMTMEMDTCVNTYTVCIPYSVLNSQGMMKHGIQIVKSTKPQCTILQLFNLQKITVPPWPVVVNMLYYNHYFIATFKMIVMYTYKLLIHFSMSYTC